MGYIITSSFFSGVARTWTLVDARLLCYNRYALSSPFCPPFHRPSLMNFVMSFFFFISSQTNTTPQIITQSALVLLLTRITAVVCLMFCHYCCCRCSGALCIILLGNDISFTTPLHHPHTFFRNFLTHPHFFLSLRSAGLPQSSTNKKNPLSHRCA